MTMIIDIQNVGLNFPAAEKFILSGINYQANTGDFIVILGSNGSGKSSLLKILNQQYQATTGKVLLDNKNLKSYSEKNLTRNIKTLTQNYNESLFTSLTVLENYLIVKQFYQPDLLAVKLKEEREYFANYLVKFNPNLPMKLDQMVAQLSGGEKQALALALTVLYPPRILLLDEHTSALDPKSADRLMQLTHQIAEEYNITCFLTTHDLAIAENYGTRILALRQGRVHHTIERSDEIEVNQQQLLAACY